MKATARLHDLGQSLWLDNITRDLLDGGTLARYVSEPVGGYFGVWKEVPQGSLLEIDGAGLEIRPFQPEASPPAPTAAAESGA